MKPAKNLRSGKILSYAFEIAPFNARNFRFRHINMFLIRARANPELTSQRKRSRR